MPARRSRPPIEALSCARPPLQRSWQAICVSMVRRRHCQRAVSVLNTRRSLTPRRNEQKTTLVQDFGTPTHTIVSLHMPHVVNMYHMRPLKMLARLRKRRRALLRISGTPPSDGALILAWATTFLDRCGSSHSAMMCINS
ncbi:hypothetical protein EVG20_g9299 [Dentipellis fragilis]|uniref:Uncharacterized protein n=1 Tax=Dentipellis fragilis TaxID=205917 RepID=A0A4Y9Y3Y7_9AGAM|nr:hypothetical protein EVG20_g9299 [Dentipellis fragilis]